MAHVLPSDISCDEGFYCLAKWAYVVTDGWFYALLLLGFIVITIMSLYRFGTTRSFGFGAALGLLGAMWLVTMQLMTWWVASAFIIAGIIGIVAMIMNER